MNNAAVTAGAVALPPWNDALCEYTLKILDEIPLDNWDVSILLCDDETIRALNAQYRGRDEATDVLSFALGTEEKYPDGSVRFLAGDIVISLDTLRENSRYFRIAEDEELRRLLIHGILHLNGMDHETNGPDEPMIVVQEKILQKLGNEHILPNADVPGEGNK
ncbi:MAG: rRNA maturation RNase YbeY [Treponema sp.]|nr:rRNA maturation RNase YbeY [Treponema sp.]